MFGVSLGLLCQLVLYFSITYFFSFNPVTVSGFFKLFLLFSKQIYLGAVYKGRPANGEGGGVVCESSDVRKFMKIEIPKFLRAL